ncbi:hypothetical protein C9I56_34570 [Paraburkholderia caribensis]|nr:hypothetical protein C9I56_34570 [Paraburkholderia caribensis]
MASKPRRRKRQKAPRCPPVGARMRYGERTVLVIAEVSGQRVIVESVDREGRIFRSMVEWARSHSECSRHEIPNTALMTRHDIEDAVNL